MASQARSLPATLKEIPRGELTSSTSGSARASFRTARSSTAVAPSSTTESLQVFNHEQLRPALDRNSAMFGCRAGRDQKPIPCFERDDLAVEADAEPALQHIPHMAGFTPMFGP